MTHTIEQGTAHEAPTTGTDPQQPPRRSRRTVLGWAAVASGLVAAVVLLLLTITSVLALTRPGIDVSMPRGILIPLQLLAVLALAELSYRFVELPFRRRPKAPPTEARAGSATRARRCWWGARRRPPGRLERRRLDRRAHLAASAAASTAEFAKVEVEPRRGGRRGPARGSRRRTGRRGSSPSATR